MKGLTFRRCNSLRHYYHVTRKDFGQRWKPEKLYSQTENRPTEEPLVARICVCSTVSGCLSAIGQLGKMFVYRTLRKCRPIFAQQVCDAKITGERWILKPVTFIYYEELPSDLLEDIRKEICFLNCGDPNCLNEQRLELKTIRRICRAYGWN